MTPADVLGQLDVLDDDLILYTAIAPYAGADTAAVVARPADEPDEPDLPDDAAGSATSSKS